MATGKRAGSRRGAKPPASVSRPVLALAALITVCVVAWGYLVFLAIDFGTAARSGASGGWGLLALASMGAMACLFAGLLFVSRLLCELGIILPPEESDDPSPATTLRTPGGRRASR